MKIIFLSTDLQADTLWDFAARHGTPIPARTISEVLAHLPQASTAVLVRATALDSSLIRLLCQFPAKGIIAPVVVVATMTDGVEALRASHEAARAGLVTFIHSMESVPALLAALQPPYHDLMHEVLTGFGHVSPEVRRIIEWLANGGQAADCDEFAASLDMPRSAFGVSCAMRVCHRPAGGAPCSPCCRRFACCSRTDASRPRHRPPGLPTSGPCDVHCNVISICALVMSDELRRPRRSCAHGASGRVANTSECARPS